MSAPTLRTLAPGKVNLCLFVGERRADGLHELVSLVQPVSLADEVALEPAGGADADEVICADVPEPNLAAAALAAYREATGWDGAPVRLSIEKRVPVAGGMGGGSSDAAAALRLAARAAGRPDDPRLATLAARLGADVPSLLDPSLALMTGAGEHLAPVRERSPYGMVLVPAHAQLSTAEVYAEADRRGGLRSAAELAGLAERLTEVLEVSAELPPTELLVNDLEPAARALCPDIDRVLEVVRAAGAAHAIVTGSGPTVVGLFPGVEGPALAAVAAAELAGSHPAAAAAAPLPPGFLDA